MKKQKNIVKKEIQVDSQKGYDIFQSHHPLRQGVTSTSSNVVYNDKKISEFKKVSQNNDKETCNIRSVYRKLAPRCVSGGDFFVHLFNRFGLFSYKQKLLITEYTEKRSGLQDGYRYGYDEVFLFKALFFRSLLGIHLLCLKWRIYFVGFSWLIIIFSEVFEAYGTAKIWHGLEAAKLPALFCEYSATSNAVALFFVSSLFLCLFYLKNWILIIFKRELTVVILGWVFLTTLIECGSAYQLSGVILKLVCLKGCLFFIYLWIAIVFFYFLLAIFLFNSWSTDSVILHHIVLPFFLYTLCFCVLFYTKGSVEALPDNVLFLIIIYWFCICRINQYHLVTLFIKVAGYLFFWWENPLRYLYTLFMGRRSFIFCFWVAFLLWVLSLIVVYSIFIPIGVYCDYINITQCGIFSYILNWSPLTEHGLEQLYVIKKKFYFSFYGIGSLFFFPWSGFPYSNVFLRLMDNSLNACLYKNYRLSYNQLTFRINIGSWLLYFLINIVVFDKDSGCQLLSNDVCFQKLSFSQQRVVFKLVLRQCLKIFLLDGKIFGVLK